MFEVFCAHITPNHVPKSVKDCYSSALLVCVLYLTCVFASVWVASLVHVFFPLPACCGLCIEHSTNGLPKIDEDETESVGSSSSNTNLLRRSGEKIIFGGTISTTIFQEKFVFLGQKRNSYIQEYIQKDDRNTT